MYYCNYIDAAGREHSNVYHAFSAYLSDTFSPETEVKHFIKFWECGRTYAERKAHIRETAQLFQEYAAPGLSYGELADVTSWFEKTGRKYGLLTEFRENGIC